MKNMLKELLSPDAIKCIYRGNFTKGQAGLYFGVGETEIQKLIDKGELPINFQKGEERISRAACDRYLQNKEYRKVV